MAIKVARGQVTIIDQNDAVSLQAFVASNQPLTQVYNKDTDVHAPTWVNAPYLELTPSLFVSGKGSADQISTIGNASNLTAGIKSGTPKWYKDGVEIKTGQNNCTIGNSSAKYALTIKANHMSITSPQVRYSFEAAYLDANGLEVAFRADIQFTQHQSAGATICAIAYAPDGVVFKNDEVDELRAHCDLWRGAVIDDTDVEYVWGIKESGVFEKTSLSKAAKTGAKEITINSVDNMDAGSKIVLGIDDLNETGKESVIFDEWISQSFNSIVTNGIFTFIASGDRTMEIDSNVSRFSNGETYISRMKTGGKTDKDERLIKIACPTAGTVRFAARTGSNDAINRRVLCNLNGKVLFQQVIKESDAVQEEYDDNGTTNTRTIYPIHNIIVEEAGELIISAPDGSINFYYFEFQADEDAVPEYTKTLYTISSVNEGTKVVTLTSALLSDLPSGASVKCPYYNYMLGIGWAQVTATSPRGVTSGWRTNEITITADAVLNFETFKCAIRDTDTSIGNTSGDTVVCDIISFTDMSDPIMVDITSQKGFIIKNNSNDVDAKAVLYRNGEEIDEAGTYFSYTWKLWNAAGTSVAQTYTGKSVTISKDHVKGKGVLMCEVAK